MSRLRHEAWRRFAGEANESLLAYLNNSHHFGFGQTASKPTQSTV
jgi:hypothetical protein